MEKCFVVVLIFLLSFSQAEASDFKNVNWKTVTAEEVDGLIKSGADVNARDTWGGSPLMSVVRYIDDPAIVKMLIDAGANVNERNAHERRLLKEADAYNKNPARYRGADPSGCGKVKNILFERFIRLRSTGCSR